MRRCWNGIASAAIAMLAITACTSVRDAEITAENQEEVLRRIRESHDVTPEEAELVGQYLVRSRLGAALGGIGADATLPATVAQIIERQRAFRDEMARREQEREAERQRLEEEARVAVERRRQEIEQLRTSFPGQVVEFGFRESDYRARRYRDEFLFRIRVTNAGAREIRGIRGRFVFLDTFGSEVGAVGVGVEESIAPGAHFESVYTRDYNQFMEADRALRGFDLAHGTVRWEPSHVVFADGSSVLIE